MSREIRMSAVGWWAGACLASLPVWSWAEEIAAEVQQPRTVLRIPAPLPPADAPADHPLRPVIAMAAEGYQRIQREVKDYTCILVRRERIDGRLRPPEFIFAKVRHRQVDGNQIVVPFGVYLKFLKPASVGGREVLYVEGYNDGEMFARRGGTRFAFVTTRLHPESDLAMRGNRYPVTQFGIENLLRRLLISARDGLATHCDVDILPGAKVNDRPAKAIVVTHQSPQESPDFYQARIFVDKELELPVHFESYGWPELPGEEPELIEQYSYTRLELNRGLTDADFSEDNPQYQVK